MSKMSIFLNFCKGSDIAPKNLIMATRIQRATYHVALLFILLLLTLTFIETD